MDEIMESLNNVEDMRKSLQEVSNIGIRIFKKFLSIQNKKLSIIFEATANTFCENKIKSFPESLCSFCYLITPLESWTLIKNSLLELGQAFLEKNMQK